MLWLSSGLTKKNVFKDRLFASKKQSQNLKRDELDQS